ncbi:BldC family transcriptional regulator [Nocardiopsis lucentensis]|uniref:BldC family transcriptional regulator n=1 Tax=Nocardiopsis lucentensis TaxID=53441 RepID=UPI0003470974|nr:BldC family transcriptional regulator [Nocardiopsis lucentensis]
MTPLNSDNTSASPEALTPAEVAALFRVDSQTVTRWAKEGRISSFRTPGGHRRYLRSEVAALWTEHLTPAN